MSRIESLTTLWAELRAVARVVPQIPRLLPTAPWSPARLLEERAREHGSRPALLFEDRRYSWEEVDREVFEKTSNLVEFTVVDQKDGRRLHRMQLPRQGCATKPLSGSGNPHPRLSRTVTIDERVAICCRCC